MKQEDLRKIGMVQLEIMDEVHRICEKHNITYYMIAGTLLGAIRHGGFIPWDLDIDIAMMRPEYERFKEVCRTELDEKYTYLDHESDRKYIRPHALVSKKNTKLEIMFDHLNPKTMNLGVYLDIFPLDNAPDDEALRGKQEQALKKIQKLKAYAIPYSYSRRAWKRYAHYAVSLLLSWIPVRKINLYQQKQMQEYRHQQTKCVCSMASRYAYKKQCMDREVYGVPVKLEFEGRQYYAPEKYTQYLTQLYGDYMQLPPIEKRQANLEIYTSVEFE